MPYAFLVKFPCFICRMFFHYSFLHCYLVLSILCTFCILYISPNNILSVFVRGSLLFENSIYCHHLPHFLVVRRLYILLVSPISLLWYQSFIGFHLYLLPHFASNILHQNINLFFFLLYLVPIMLLFLCPFNFLRYTKI